VGARASGAARTEDVDAHVTALEAAAVAALVLAPGAPEVARELPVAEALQPPQRVDRCVVDVEVHVPGLKHAPAAEEGELVLAALQIGGGLRPFAVVLGFRILARASARRARGRARARTGTMAA
jgi:hypothetical protein